MLTEKQLKEELHALAAEETREAYVSAILTFGGSLCKDEKGYYLVYSSSDYLLAWEFASYLREKYDYHAEVGIVDPDDKRRNRYYKVEVRGRNALGLLSDVGKVKAYALLSPDSFICKPFIQQGTSPSSGITNNF